MSSFSTTVYDTNSYDAVPDYDWGSTFQAKSFVAGIERINDQLFEDLKVTVCQKLQIGYQRTGCKSNAIESFIYLKMLDQC